MKIYVAGRFSEKDEVRRVHRLLRAAGHTITTDWTRHKNVKPYDQHSDLAGKYAVEDLDGVLACDAFILLTSAEAGSGVSAELGGAIAAQSLTGKPRIYVLGDHMQTNAFHFHPAVIHAATITDVLADL